MPTRPPTRPSTRPSTRRSTGPSTRALTSASTRPRAAAPAPRGAYHHGDLRAALIEASEALLAERGLDGFSLREVARRSGVSPAAPAHHFGDAQGLLMAVATLAFDGLTAALEAGNVRGGNDPVARLREQGVGYVGFALAHPGRFGLMFRTGIVTDEALLHSSQAAFTKLEEGVRLLVGVPVPAPMGAAHWQLLLSVWSVVHGFAHLAQAGRIGRFAPPGGREALLRELLAPMLELHLRALAPVSAAPAARPPGSRNGRSRVTSGSR